MWCPRSRSGGAIYGGSENELSVSLYLEVLVSATRESFHALSNHSLLEGESVVEEVDCPCVHQRLEAFQPRQPIEGIPRK